MVNERCRVSFAQSVYKGHSLLTISKGFRSRLQITFAKLLSHIHRLAL
jgi:hypothetical protein